MLKFDDKIISSVLDEMGYELLPVLKEDAQFYQFEIGFVMDDVFKSEETINQFKATIKDTVKYLIEQSNEDNREIVGFKYYIEYKIKYEINEIIRMKIIAVLKHQ